MSGYAPTRNYVFYEMSGSLPTRFTLKQRFKWGKISTSTLKNAILSHLFTLYVILRREYTHSFGSKCLIRVGWGPLVFVKVCTSSGPAPTRFQVFPAFEWGIIPLVYVILIKIPSLPAEPLKRARIKMTVSLFHELRSRSNGRRNVPRGRSRLHDCGCRKYVLLSAGDRDDCTLHLDHIRGFPTGDLLQPYPPLP